MRFYNSRTGDLESHIARHSSVVSRATRRAPTSAKSVQDFDAGDSEVAQMPHTHSPTSAATELSLPRNAEPLRTRLLASPANDATWRCTASGRSRCLYIVYYPQDDARLRACCLSSACSVRIRTGSRATPWRSRLGASTGLRRCATEHSDFC